MHAKIQFTAEGGLNTLQSIDQEVNNQYFLAKYWQLRFRLTCVSANTDPPLRLQLYRLVMSPIDIFIRNPRGVLSGTLS